ncbi:M23 family metallopeptidase [Yoonia sp. 208BN28-4]|uniref:M23 family metallopeptidase n=1 Tax=Yoonia sp. 208BN28-4 TaxID=3126505 RepID=UPI0030A1F0C5
MRLSTATIFSLAAYPVAGEFSLDPPIDCVLGDTCHIQQFVDHDPTDAASNFRCGPLTYDTHKGTDFALPSLAAKAAGIAVLAASAGEVTALRSHLPDILQGEPDAPDVRDVECGNGVLLRHPDGWETQYCHLAQDSITVAVGDRVEAGDTLGFVGLSGSTEFPHLHISVRQNGDVVDPFDPDGEITCDQPSNDTLWSTPLDAPEGGLIASGFATAIPDYADVKAGTAAAPVIATDDAALVLWGYAFGTRADDIVTLNIIGPDGEVFANDETLDRTQAQMFRAGGRRTPDTGWSIGDYTGTVTLTRDGAVLDTQVVTIAVKP